MQSFHKDKVFRINSVESTSENTEEMKLLTVDAKTNHACLVVLCVAGRSQKDPSIIILMDLREEEERLESVTFFFFLSRCLFFSALYDLEEVPSRMGRMLKDFPASKTIR